MGGPQTGAEAWDRREFKRMKESEDTMRYLQATCKLLAPYLHPTCTLLAPYLHEVSDVLGIYTPTCRYVKLLAKVGRHATRSFLSTL